MAVLLAPGPFGAGGQFFDANGKMLNAGIINTYAAGTTTPLATYTTSTGNVANALSITLGVDGRPPQEIWFTAGSAYRLDLLDSLNNLIKTYDNLTGINDITGIGEWIATNLTPVFISATSFSLTGNQTTILPNDIRIKTANTAGTIYSTIVSGTYASIPNTTTFVVANDFGTVLDSGLSSVSYSILSPVNPSIDADMVNRKASLVTSAGVTDIWSAAGDYLHITGGTVTSITSFGTAFYAGNNRDVIADASFVIQNGAAIQCIGSANISAIAGDRFQIRAETTTVANIVRYTHPATKAEQVARVSFAAQVTPGAQQFHPSAAKAWAMCNAAGTIQNSYNVTSTFTIGTGTMGFNFITSFTTANYIVAATSLSAGVSVRSINVSSQTVSNVSVKCIGETPSLTDPTNYFIACFGDQ